MFAAEVILHSVVLNFSLNASNKKGKREKPAKQILIGNFLAAQPKLHKGKMQGNMSHVYHSTFATASFMTH